MSKKLYLVDGYALIYRSYFAFIRKPLFNPQGKNSSAVFGFFRTLLSIIQQRSPESLAVVFDSMTPTFRHEKYPDYKATREKAPDDLHAQVPVIEEILSAMGISQLRQNGVEADDIIATYADRAADEGWDCVIITGDKDLMQLIGGNVTAMIPDKSGGYAEVGPAEVSEKWGVTPEQMLDYLSLVGDQSDNVPGVKGIGPKGAVDLISKFTSLEGIYENLDKLSPRQQEKFRQERDNAFLSKELISLKKDVQDLPEPEEFVLGDYDKEQVIRLFLREGATSLAEQLGTAKQVRAEKKEESYSKESSRYTALLASDELDELKKAVHKAKLFALDVETDSLDPMRAQPVGISIALEPGQAWYIPLKCEGTETLAEDRVRQMIAEILEKPDCTWIGQNLKYDYKVLKHWGITEINTILFDTMVAAWLLDSTANTFGMDALAERLLRYRTIHFNDVVPKGKAFHEVPLDQAVSYAAEDADITFRLYEYLKPKLEEESLAGTFCDLEMPVTRVLAEMEYAGIGLDGASLERYGKELAQSLNGIQKEIWDLCGREFNINSTKQLQVVLFEERKLSPVKKTKTGYSTDTSVLEQLAEEDPVPQLILRHRGLAKLKSTYVDTLPKEINPHTGRIHTSFLQTGTATGRLASKNPNLQNIPVRDEAGRAIRSAFIPKKGHRFISADYAQIELAVFAHLSGDEALSRAFEKGTDIHRQTAALIFGVDESAVNPEQRRVAKTINFGVIYGMSPFRLSNELRISRSDAASFIEAYFAQYPKVRAFIDTTIAEAEKSTYVRTLMGHRRFVPGITSRNKTEKSGAERIAVNTPVQGSAADIVKAAMLKLDKALNDGGYRTKLLLQVHDELILEAPEDEVEEVSELVVETMQSAVELSVPLKVSIESGDSWGAVH
ncbi:DNA polymerase I [Marispirochaeta sp.]|uniref:DNA polymerase I n=1 Tax=Marispirochaeta sp. TaxID=2038653 RepID=UPI0029C9978C|nr:DNA polymerase I [Marispirochaeta sp.]